MDYPPIWILLTTYERTACAVRTVEALKKNMLWPNIGWWISDDGSQPEHVQAIIEAIGPTYDIRWYNSMRRGVGVGMNYSLRQIWNLGDLVLMMEDDWELNQPLDFTPFVSLLTTHAEIGMIRYGYLSPNLLGYLITAQNELWWRLEPNAETYRFVGHPSLRHRRFHEIYGYYDEGLPPGMTELSMCGKVNQRPEGPAIVFPASCGRWGYFGHIGTDSLADIAPKGS